jgi:hypothetical protein
MAFIDEVYAKFKNKNPLYRVYLVVTDIDEIPKEQLDKLYYEPMSPNFHAGQEYIFVGAKEDLEKLIMDNWQMEELLDQIKIY